MKKFSRLKSALVAAAFSALGLCAADLAHAQQAPGIPGADQPIGAVPQQLFPGRSLQGQLAPVWDDKVPALSGGENLTAISGRVVDLDGKGIAGVAVRDGEVSTITDDQGRYLLAGVPSGDSVMQIDARRAGLQRVTDYGSYEIKVAATAGITNFLPYKNWLPRIDHENEVTIESPTKAEVVLTNPGLPGIEVHIPAGTVITGSDHQPVTKIGLTPIPSDKTPFPLPHNVTVPQYFTIQPGGATLAGVDGQWVGAQVWYPNYNKERPGAKGTFWRYDPYREGWQTYGTGTVSKDGRHVVPDEGVRLYDFTAAMFNWATPPWWWPTFGEEVTPGCESCLCGDPIDPGSGLWVERFVDLSLNDVTPLSLIRTYRQGDVNRRSFGIGMTLNYEMYLASTDPQNPYQQTDLIMPDGGRIHFTRTSPGTTWSDAAFVANTTSGQFYGATIVWNGQGWDLKTLDGSLYVFADNAPLKYYEDRYGNRVTLTRATPTSPVSAITSSNGRWIKFTYGANNLVATATDNSGRTVTYGYDPSNNYLQTVTDPNGGVTTFIWDTSNDRITSIRYPRQQPSGPVAMTNTYDANGRVQSQALPGNVSYTFAYTLNGTSVTATDVTMTDTSYTPARTTVCKHTFNSAGYWKTNKLAAGQMAIEQNYTAFYGGEPIPPVCAQNTPANTPANSPTNTMIGLTDSLGRTTCWTYSPAGKILSETRLAGSANPITTTYTYGPYSQIASIKDPLNHTTTISLDNLGSPTGITIPLLPAADHTWQIHANPNGQIESITDPLSHKTSFTYDHSDLTKVTDALSRVSTFYTDSLGREIQSSDPRGNVWQFVHDKIWGVRVATDPNNNAVTTNYNAAGLVSSVVDPRNASFTTQYAYDTQDRLTTRTDPLARNDTINTYDGFDNPRTTTDRKGQNANYTYDLLGRIATATLADGHVLDYAWDKGNRLTQINDTVSGTVNQVSRTYDDLDRLTSETVKQGPVASPATIGSVTYTYDNASRRDTMTASGQTKICYVYDNADQLTTITQGTGVNCTTGLTTLESFTYDKANRSLTMTRPASGILATYAYTDADELTSITYTKNATTIGAVTYTYDAAGRIASRGGSLFKSALPAATTATAIFNADNQLTSWNGAALTYDLNGNLTNDGTRTFTWDASNRLTGITGIASYAYDAAARRQTVSQGGGGSPVTVVLSAGTSWTVPANFNAANNTITLIGGGGGGGGAGNGTGGGGGIKGGSGGGGGEARVLTNWNPNGQSAITFAIGSGGANGTAGTGGVGTAGTDGGDTVWDSASASPTRAKGGKAGLGGAGGSGAGPAGGLGGTGGTGGTGLNGGNGGAGGARNNSDHGGGGGGGGGAGGPNAVGNNGGAASTTHTPGNGGQGDGTFGGAGSSTATQPGSPGTEIGGVGSGGGGRGGGDGTAGGGTGAVLSGTAGGNYGAGGGGATGGNLTHTAASTRDGGVGMGGVIVIQYTPSGGGTAVTALYDGYDPVQEQSPTGTVSANLQTGLGVDQRFTRTKGGVTSTYLTDLLGSTVALADSAGVVQTSYGYDPYGVTTQTGAANDNQFQFTGRQNDGTGLNYYRARYYNPVWGRFISEDPVGLAAGPNLYGYADGAPTMYPDPYGLYIAHPTPWRWRCFTWGLAVGAIYSVGAAPFAFDVAAVGTLTLGTRAAVGAASRSIPTSVEGLVAAPGAVYGKTAAEIADAFAEQGFGVTVRQGTRGTKTAQVVEVHGHPQITQVQVHPGGGRHVGDYVKYSTSTNGTIKVIGPSYKGSANEGAVFFPVGN